MHWCTLVERQKGVFGLAEFAPIGRFVRGQITRPDYSQWQRAYEDGYLRNGVVQACINVLANTLKEPPCVAVSAEQEPIYDHPFTRLMQRPNPSMSAADFWQTVATQTLIGGYCVIRKVRTTLGTVGALWPYHAGLVAPYIGESGWLEGWTYNNGVRTERWDVNDVIVIRSDYAHPERPFIAISPIVMAGDAVTILNEMETTVLAFMQNGGSPGWIIKPLQNPTEEQKAGFIARFRELFTGRGAGRPMFIDKETEVERLSVKLEELDTASVAAQYQAEICGVFRVHPVVAMTFAGLQNSTYSNMESAYREFTNLTRVPTWVAWADALRQGFAQEFPDVNIQFDLSNIAALKADPEGMVYPTITAWREGVIKRNEARGRIGFDADDEADGYYNDLNVRDALPVQLSAVNNNDPDAAQDRANDWAEERSVAYWQAVDNVITRYANGLREYVVRMADDAIDDMTRATRQNPDNISVPRLVQRFIEGSAKLRRSVLRELMHYYVEAAGGQGIEQYIDTVTANTTRVLNKQITTAAGTLKKTIIEVVAENARKTDKDIKQAILDRVKQYKESDAERVAVTSARASSTEAAISTWEEMDEEIEKVWLTRRDSKVRPSHAAMDGKVVGLRENFIFPNGAEGIGPALADEAASSINCRCVIRPRRVKR